MYVMLTGCEFLRRSKFTQGKKMETLLDLLFPDFDQVCVTGGRRFGDWGGGVPERETEIKNP